MTKAEHIAYWVDIAEDDWGPVQRMMAAGDYVQGLFFAHLVIEKLSKAHWVKDNADNIPPKTHNIGRLWQATHLVPTPTQIALAVRLNDYQLEGRYADYLRKLKAQTTSTYATQIFADITTLRLWLLNSMP